MQRSAITSLVLVLTACCVGAPLSAQPARADVCAKPIGDVLTEIESIKVGMNRGQLLLVFTTEGGLSTPLQRTYVYRGCPVIKVDVEFQIVGRPERDSTGRVTVVEVDEDLIRKISRPYLAWSIMD